METNNNIEQFDDEKNFSSIPKSNNFSVPTDYFDFLPEEIMNRVHLRSQPKKVFFLLKPIIAIPSLAVLSGVIALFFFFHKEVVLADEVTLSENEIQQVIDNPELYNIDKASITEAYLASNISYEPVNEESTVSEEEIKSYLEDNNEVTNIINE
jgi:hypothetical protein